MLHVDAVPLTSLEKRAVLEVAASYKAYWNAGRFASGFAQPKLSLAECEHDLHLAAECVVRILRAAQSLLSPASPTGASCGDAVSRATSRVLRASAAWEVLARQATAGPELVRALVRATLRGPVLAESTIDAAIAAVDALPAAVRWCGFVPAHPTGTPADAETARARALAALERACDLLRKAEGGADGGGEGDSVVWAAVASAAERAASVIATLLAAGALPPGDESHPHPPAAAAGGDPPHGGDGGDGAAPEGSPTGVPSPMIHPVDSPPAPPPEGTTPTTLTDFPSPTDDRPADDPPPTPAAAAAAAADGQESVRSVPTSDAAQIRPLPPSESGASEPPPRPAPPTLAIPPPGGQGGTPSSPGRAAASGASPGQASDAGLGGSEPLLSPGTEGLAKQRIAVAQADAERQREVLAALSVDAEALAEGAGGGGSAVEKAREVERVQKRCLATTEALMRDLLALDALAAPTPALRGARKGAVVLVNSLLSDVDSIAAKLRGAHAAAAAAAAAEAAAAARAAAQQKEELVRAIRALPPPRMGPDDWARLPLQVEWRRDGDVISACIPGLQLADVAVRLSSDKTSVLVDGLRMPTAAEVADAWGQCVDGLIAHAGGGGAGGAGMPSEEEQRHALLAAFQGRFGRFTAALRIPPGVDTARVGADYTDGVLAVEMPPLPHPRGRHAQHPFSRPAYGGFGGGARGYDRGGDSDPFSFLRGGGLGGWPSRGGW